MNYTGIIILNYNNWEDTINCVESVEKYNSSPIKYIVVDNGSTNSEAIPKLDEYFNAKFPGGYAKLSDGDALPTSYQTIFLASSTNDGYARGNNKGLTLAYQDPSIDTVLILNNDILFVADIIPTLLNELATIPSCGVVSPLLYGHGKQTIDYNCARKNISAWELLFTYLCWYQDVFGIFSRQDRKHLLLKSNPHLLKERRFEIELPSGSCMLMKKELMQHIDGFDSGTFLYYEENILYKKLQRLDKHSYLIPGCECIHLGACSTKKTKGTFALRHQFKSSLYYMQTFCQLNIVQKALLRFVRIWFDLKLRLIDYTLKSHG